MSSFNAAIGQNEVSRAVTILVCHISTEITQKYFCRVRFTHLSVLVCQFTIAIVRATHSTKCLV